MKLKIFFLFFIFNSIAACTTSPQYIVLAPEIIHTPQTIYASKKIQLNVIDQRSSNQVVQILQDNKPARLLSSQDTLSNIIQKTISPVFQQQGLAVNSFAATKVTIIINTALINVQQKLVNYHATNTLSLTVIVATGNKNVSKTFDITGKSNGPLTADIAVLERSFNNQLASLLTRISNNSDVQHAINASQRTN